MNHLIKNLSYSIMLALAVNATAYAQSTRTWVSGVGDDANPCSRTAPCKTFAGAISKTADHGEISALDPGGFGAVTITKSVTINGDGTLAGILASGTNGVIVNAANTDVVKLRNLSINGAGTGLNGIRLLNAALLELDNVSISGFTGNGIDVNLGDSGKLIVRDSSISDVTGSGVSIASSVTTANVSAVLDHVSIQSTGTAVDSNYALASTWLSGCTLTGNSAYGVYAQAGSVGLEHCLLTGNAVGVQAQTGARIRLIDTTIFDNTTGIGCGGGILSSAQNNSIAASPVCSKKTKIIAF